MVPMTEKVQFVPMHATFGAEVKGVDFSNPVSEDALEALKDGLGKYGVIVMRDTKMTDEQFVTFSERFGELAPNGTGSERFACQKLSDPSNLYPDGSMVKEGELRWFLAKETNLFHVDNSHDPRRVRFTALIARECPPEGTGGPTEFADTRAAYDDLDGETKKLVEGKVAAHSHIQSRKVALPNFPTFATVDAADYPMFRFPLVVTHRGSDRKNLYLAHMIHHIEGMDEKESSALIQKLMQHAEQEKYITPVYYKQPGDVVMWDNTAVMHRAGKGDWAGRHRRDIRKTTTYDNTPEEWGLNDKSTPKFLANPVFVARHEELFGKDGLAMEYV